MLRAMIVEDNAIYRYAIRTIVRWEDYGFEIAAEALNGKHALELLQSHPVDLIVTDISMPEMNGVDLIRAVKERSPHIAIVALSSFDDFRFVKQALLLGAADYVLKHELEPEGLQRVLEQMCERIGTERRQRASEREWQRGMAKARADAVRKLLTGGEAGGEGWQALGLPAPGVPLAVLLLAVSPAADAAAGSGGAIARSGLESAAGTDGADGGSGSVGPDGVRGSAESLITAVVGVGCGGFGVELSPRWSALIVWFERERGEYDVYARAHRAAAELAAAFRASGDAATVGMSGIGYKARDLALLYRQAESALARALYEGRGRVYAYAPPRSSGTVPVRGDDRAAAPLPALAAALKSGDRQQFERQLGPLFGKAEAERYGFAELRQLLDDLYVVLKADALERRLAAAPFERWHEEALRSLEELTPVRHYEQSVAALLPLLFGAAPPLSSRREIQLMLEYIHAYYADNIAVADLARALNLSANYVSNLFKSETGMRLTEYVNRYRIHIAKTLLRDPCLKVYEVAQRSGFQDVSYFCRVFKELEDITVTAYRRSLPAVLLPGVEGVASQ